ncbi:MAG: hypothetical protein ACLP3R_01935, partial [Candidatus Korobacteraceae bacterium]
TVVRPCRPLHPGVTVTGSDDLTESTVLIRTCKAVLLVLGVHGANVSRIGGMSTKTDGPGYGRPDPGNHG